MGNKDKQSILNDLQNSDSIHFDAVRYRFLTNQRDIYWRRAAALILSENGYSHSGIAGLLDVTKSTASGYLDDLEDTFGKDAIEAHPQSEPQEELWPNEYDNPFGE